MKKLLLIFSVFICYNASAQGLFTLEKSLEGMYSFNYDYETANSFINLSLPEQKNVFYPTSAEISGNTIKYRYYDIDYNVTVTEYTLQIPENYQLNSVYKISMPGYDDCKWFIATMMNTDIYGESEYFRIIMFDENGKAIYEFKSSSSTSTVFPMLYLIKNRYKLLIYRNEGISLYTDIYALNLEIESNIANTVKMRAIPLTQIFKMNGELVQETDKDIRPNSFEKGVYIIKEKDKTRKVLLGM